jgi:hypothetical protein
VIKDDAEALALLREAMLKQEGGDKRGQTTCNNVGGDNAVTGNSRAYSIDRVRRECDEETVQLVMSGDLSPNTALVKAGIRENRQMYIPRDPAKAAAKIRQQFGAKFARKVPLSITGTWLSADPTDSRILFIRTWRRKRRDLIL